MLKKHRFDNQISTMHFILKAFSKAWNEVINAQAEKYHIGFMYKQSLQMRSICICYKPIY